MTAPEGAAASPSLIGSSFSDSQHLARHLSEEPIGFGFAHLADFAPVTVQDHSPRVGFATHRAKRPSAAVNTESRAPKGKHFPDDPLPSDHLRFLHGDATSKQVGLRRLSDSHNPRVGDAPIPRKATKVSISTLLGWVDSLAGESRVYLTQGSFVWGAEHDKFRHKTTRDYLREIGVVFVDLDIYANRLWEGESTEVVTGHLLALCRKEGIPDPLVICSGRGLYAYWALDKRLRVSNEEAVATWRSVQNRLIGLLQPFGADTRVSDMTRILRLVGTTNEKTGDLVRVVHDDGQRYSLAQLSNATSHLPVFQTRKAAGEQGGEKAPSKVRRTGQRSGTITSPAGDDDKPTPEALEQLRAMLRQDEAVIDSLPAMKARHYRIFKDIATVVLARGGLAHGERDEFQFWLLTTRFNAGLYTVGELPYLAEVFSGLAWGKLNLWESGMLSTLHDRMVEQTKRMGTFRAVRKHAGRRGGFGVERMLPRRRSDAEKAGYGAGFVRPVVYTPSVATLIAKLGITEAEQEGLGLSILVGSGEKRRRRSLNNVSHRIEARNAALCRLYANGQLTVQQLADEAGLNVSSVYRILNESGGTAQVGRAARAKSLRTDVLSMVQASPGLSVREIARRTGASPSSVSRWIKGAASPTRCAASPSIHKPSHDGVARSPDLMPKLDSSKKVEGEHWVPAITIEDPPEYSITGVKQAPLVMRDRTSDESIHLGWENSIKACMRKDPNSLIGLRNSEGLNSLMAVPHSYFLSASIGGDTQGMVGNEGDGDPCRMSSTTQGQGRGHQGPVIAKYRGGVYYDEEGASSSVSLSAFAGQSERETPFALHAHRSGVNCFDDEASGPASYGPTSCAGQVSESNEDPWVIAAKAQRVEGVVVGVGGYDNPFADIEVAAPPAIGVEEGAGTDSWYSTDDEPTGVTFAAIQSSQADQVGHGAHPHDSDASEAPIVMPVELSREQTNHKYGIEGDKSNGVSGSVSDEGDTIDLAEIKAMALDSDVVKAWSHQDVMRFQAHLEQIEPGLSETKLKARRLRAMLVGNAEMKAILLNIYEIAASVTA